MIDTIASLSNKLSEVTKNREEWRALAFAYREELYKVLNADFPKRAYKKCDKCNEPLDRPHPDCVSWIEKAANFMFGGNNSKDWTRSYTHKNPPPETDPPDPHLK